MKTNVISFLQLILQNNNIISQDNAYSLNIPANSDKGFGITTELENGEINLYFDDVYFNYSIDEYEDMIGFFIMALTGNIRIKYTSKREKVFRTEVEIYEEGQWKKIIDIHRGNYHFWIPGQTSYRANTYTIQDDWRQLISNEDVSV